MILFISSQEQSSESRIEPRFGRSDWLIRYDTEAQESEFFQNPGKQQSGGAGVATAQFVIDQGAEAVISGDFGPNAARVLQAGNVPMYLFSETVHTIPEVLEAFGKGELPAF